MNSGLTCCEKMCCFGQLTKMSIFVNDNRMGFILDFNCFFLFHYAQSYFSDKDLKSIAVFHRMQLARIVRIQKSCDAKLMVHLYLDLILDFEGHYSFPETIT
ncbi:hypothetical protein ACOSP7_028844 [Xanthoceras sorbifolium]